MPWPFCRHWPTLETSTATRRRGTRSARQSPSGCRAARSTITSPALGCESYSRRCGLVALDSRSADRNRADATDPVVRFKVGHRRPAHRQAHAPSRTRRRGAPVACGPVMGIGLRGALVACLLVSAGGCLVEAEQDERDDAEHVDASQAALLGRPMRHARPATRPRAAKAAIGPASCQKTTYLVANFLCRWSNGKPDACRNIAQSTATRTCKNARGGAATSQMPAAPFFLPPPAPAIALKPAQPPGKPKSSPPSQVRTPSARMPSSRERTSSSARTRAWSESAPTE
jgi:hypothetical protein